MTYDEILELINDNNLEVVEIDTPEKIKGLLLDEYIVINKNLTEIEKKCVLAEELAHYKLNCGNILDQQNISNRKQEKKARNYSYELLIPVEKFIDAFNYGCANLYEVADFMEVPINILKQALESYKRKYGMCLKIDQCYTVYFEPVGVLRKR